MVEPKIVFEDKIFLVIEKPPGLVVNRAITVKNATLQDWLETRPSRSVNLVRSGIVHRLDKETSGLMVIAKTKAAFENLQRQFKERKVKKKYLALVYGKLQPQQGEICLPLARTKKDREKFGVVIGGRKARTKYKIKKYYKGFSFVEVELLTGRTHQIRVHLSFLGHPIVADEKYGGKRAKKDRQSCPRMFLHASQLGFYHPQTNKWQSFTSSLPFDLKKAILKICEKGSS